MTAIPANLGRVPNVLTQRLALANITRSNLGLANLQSQISSGREILRPSDDIVRASTIGVLDDRLERSGQVARNLSHAGTSLNILEAALAEANGLALEARSIALEQVGMTSSEAERRGQAAVVDQMIRGLLNTANRQGPAGSVLAGARVDSPAVEEFFGGFRYLGRGGGLTTDLGLASATPITMGGGAIAGASARLRGAADLDPALTPDTRLADLGGARGLGVTPGEIEFTFDGGPRRRVVLTGADTIEDVAARITAAVRAYEAESGVAVLGPGGVGVSGGAISVDVAPAAGGGPAPALRFLDLGSGSTARDLGLNTDAGRVFDAAAPLGEDLRPRLTWRTPVAALSGLGGPLGALRIANAGRSALIDLSGARTLGDVRNLIQTANLGVRVEINQAGAGIDVLNEVSGPSAAALSIEEAPGGSLTATRLGIRSLAAGTSLADLNFGRGVRIVDGVNSPLTGVADSALNADFRITLGDPAATALDVDLRPQDMTTVGAVLTRINQQVAAGLAAAGLPAGSLVAELSDGSNGLVLRQAPGFTGPVRVAAVNNSGAAEGLGLLGGTFDAAGNRLIAQDTARVRVDSLFTHLADLRQALQSNDPRGIGLAGEGLERSLSALAEARGLVGGFARRVEDAGIREEDRRVVDESIRSELRDTDFARAASSLALLQTQLEAGLRVAGQTGRLSLLDFLG